MDNILMRFPGGRKKALTLSYDDGVEQDIRLIDIMRRHGLKGTFNINSGMFGADRSTKTARRRSLTEQEAVALYAGSGMEVACHGVTHPFLDQLPPSACVREVYTDRVNLERIFGTMVRGLAYPFGTTSDSVVQTLKQCGIVYGRTVVCTEKFDLPADWYRLPGTCRNLHPEMMSLAKRFLESDPLTSQMFYLWGHSYEFDETNSWQTIADFARLMGDREDVWYATNLEIADYVTAFRRLIFSADGRTVYNPTNVTLYIRTRRGHFCVEPGQMEEI